MNSLSLENYDSKFYVDNRCNLVVFQDRKKKSIKLISNCHGNTLVTDDQYIK